MPNAERIVESISNVTKVRDELRRKMREIRETFGEGTRFNVRFKNGSIVGVRAVCPARHLDTLDSLLHDFGRHRRWGEVEIAADGLTVHVTIDLEIG